MNLADEVAALKDQIQEMERRLAVAERPKLGDDYLAPGVPKGAPMPPAQEPLGHGNEMFSQVVPRGVDGGGYEGMAGSGGPVTEYDADETYLHEDESVEPHVFSHEAIGDQPVPTTGSDIVRSGTGHITVTPVEHQVNPAGHIDTSKDGAIASHGNPVAGGAVKALEPDPSVIDETAHDDLDDDTATVDGTNGVKLGDLTRVSYASESVGPKTIWAFFRQIENDTKGHKATVGVEVRKPLYTPPYGDADGQMQVWNNTSKAWENVAAPAAPTTTDYVLAWDHTIPGPVWAELEDFTCP